MLTGSSGGRPQRDLEVVERRLVAGLGGEQLALRVVERLPGQVDLEAVDAAGVVRGLQLLVAVAERGDVGPLVANLLCGLQQADVAAGALGAGAAGEAAADALLSAEAAEEAAEAAEVADVAEAAAADAREAFETAAAEEAAAPRRALRPRRGR